MSVTVQRTEETDDSYTPILPTNEIVEWVFKQNDLTGITFLCKSNDLDGNINGYLNSVIHDMTQKVAETLHIFAKSAKGDTDMEKSSDLYMATDIVIRDWIESNPTLDKQRLVGFSRWTEYNDFFYAEPSNSDRDVNAQWDNIFNMKGRVDLPEVTEAMTLGVTARIGSDNVVRLVYHAYPINLADKERETERTVEFESAAGGVGDLDQGDD